MGGSFRNANTSASASVGVGPGADIRALLRAFVERSRDVKLIPSDLKISNPTTRWVRRAIHSISLLRRTHYPYWRCGGRFQAAPVRIFPGMVSGAIAADVVHEALASGASDVSAFNQRWRGELGVFLRSLPGGEQKQSTVSRIDLIFKSRLVSAMAGRIFLYGEPLSVGTFLKSL